MFWALLFATLATLQGGSDAVFLIPDAQKILKSNIKENPNKKEILTLMKAYEKVAKGNQKLVNKKEKDLERLFREKDADQDELRQLYEQIQIIQSETQNENIKTSLEVKKLITDSEWKQITVELSAKREMVVQNQERKVESLVKSVDKIITNMEESIVDEEKRQKAVQIMHDFKDEERRFRDKLIVLYDENLEVTKNKTASQNDYEVMTAKLNIARSEYFEVFIENHEEIGELTTQEEWVTIMKSIKKLY